MIVFLTEEESMLVTIRQLLGQRWPESTEGVDWIPLSFSGKSDLEKNIPKKMRSWNYGEPHFIILRDNDGSDCKQTKKRIAEIARDGGKPFTIRIVCQELESWFLGELDAVEEAFPNTSAGKHKKKAKFRIPDKIANASEELEKLTGVSAKVGRANSISECFQPDRCTSTSFKVFWQTVESLLEN